MPNGILVATDGSDGGNHAVDFAADLSANLSRNLCIVHVYLHDYSPK
ncbi:Universal stress protein family protein [Aliiruegeria lutimaris]|uniref:Universal stress protein family protein n=1 Tax=Aliiruegeria lutimaris TaxID=571298 RepID=A0A1G8QRN5_9RHOB|nr:Universal stress protein family protein [Aliiruegeria lutimaris]